MTLALNPIESAIITNRGRERPGNSLFIDNVHLVIHNGIGTRLELYFSAGGSVAGLLRGRLGSGHDNVFQRLHTT